MCEVEYVSVCLSVIVWLSVCKGVAECLHKYVNVYATARVRACLGVCKCECA